MSARIGVWIVGALGNVATLVALGARMMKRDRSLRVGLVTDLPVFDSLGLPDPAEFIFGGCDIRNGSLEASAREFARHNGVVDPQWLERCAGELDEISRRIGPAVLAGGGEAIGAMAERTHRVTRPPQAVALIQEELRDFKRRHDLDELVVVNLSSAEPNPGPIEGPLDPGAPSSVLYAFAAIDAGFPYVNFTSSVGSSLPALDRLAIERGVPHMGRDGKTGETLVKTVLAPMFAARNLSLLAWESHNILGNRDGQVLNNPDNCAGKLGNKGSVLDPSVHSHVRIDYVPSLGDWKTAWDYIHFGGFLGAKMSMQFTWQGCDSVLAAPLVLDLVRLAADGHRRGFAGAMTHAACFFKAPYGVTDHDFFRQFAALREYAVEPIPVKQTE
jgi:myo-inositol-1-phosphate synthase